MKIFIALSLLIVAASAGIMPELKHKLQPLQPLVPMAEMEGRITNGEAAKPGEFSYQVALYVNISNALYFCGGTLISRDWVMTAAHCADDVLNGIAIFGATNIQETEIGQKEISFSKSNIIVHEDWNSATLHNDIALIHLPIALEFNDYIQPASLPKKGSHCSSYEGILVNASGWGIVNDSSTTISPVLQYIIVPVLKNEICNNSYFGLITDDMICIDTQDHKSTCNGDSGGPLVLKEKDETTTQTKNVVIGITSFGIVFGCEVGWPAVFTCVPSYLDWIIEKTGISDES